MFQSEGKAKLAEIHWDKMAVHCRDGALEAENNVNLEVAGQSIAKRLTFFFPLFWIDQVHECHLIRTSTFNKQTFTVKFVLQNGKLLKHNLKIFIFIFQIRVKAVI